MRSLINDKRGLLPLLAAPLGVVITVAILIGILAIISVVFVSLNKIVIVGGGMIALSLIFGLRGEFNRTKAGFLAIVMILGLVLVMGGSVLQQVTSISTVEDSQGKISWIVNGIATGIDEGYTFNEKPSSVTNSQGDTITPQQPATLFISKKESYCEYQLNKVTKDKWFLPELTYYELRPPERVALINVRDGGGTEKTMDGTTTRTETFYANKGSLKLTTFGTLSAKRDCQEGSDIAIIIAEGGYSLKYKNELENWYDSLSAFTGIFGLLNIPEVRNNEIFVSNFEDFSLRGTERFIGDVEIGNVEFTIEADQGYYDSVVYTRPKSAKPIISSIEVASEMKADDTSGVILNINNNGEEGSIVIDATTNKGDISPTSKNDILRDSLSSSFTLKAPLSDGSGEVCFKVCSIDGENCDNDCNYFEVLKENEEAEEYCGDGICQSFESFTICPDDCEKIVDCIKDSDCKEGDICQNNKCINDELECSWFEDETTAEYTNWKWYNYATAGLIKPKVEISPVCRLKNSVLFAGMGVIILILGTIAIFAFKPTKRIVRRKKR